MSKSTVEGLATNWTKTKEIDVALDSAARRPYLCCVCVCVCVYTHIHPRTLPLALKIEKTQTTPLAFILSKITPHTKQQVLS